MPKPINVSLPPMLDYLFEVEPDVEDSSDPFQKFVEDGRSAGAFVGMSSDVAHRHIESLREETAANDDRMKKIYQGIAQAAAATDEKKLEKVAARVETVGRWKKEYDANGKLISAYEERET